MLEFPGLTSGLSFAIRKSFCHSTVNHQADAGVDTDQAECSCPEPFACLTSHQLDHPAAHRLAKQAEPDGQQEHADLGFPLAARR